MTGETAAELSPVFCHAPVILASRSPARRRLLEAAGIPFEARGVGVDEDAVKDAMLAEGARPRDIADTLAEMKALRGASRAGPDALVIGSDQVLALDGVLYSKADTLDEARATLKALRGKRHELVTAVAVAKGGAVIWRHIETPRLTMRDMSDQFLEDYLSAVGEDVLSSVGCYHLEGLGIHLMSKIEGDHFSVQGLPLLPLLQFLRDHGALDQ